MEGKPLLPLPAGFADTVVALHLVAELVVAPARKPRNAPAARRTYEQSSLPRREK